MVEARSWGRGHSVLGPRPEGRKTRSVLIMDSRHVVISAIQPETIASRFGGAPEEAAENSGEELQ